MPYPSKTNRQTILSAAVKELVHGGIRDLSLRNIAASLVIAPIAIYRYFSDRRAIEAALSSEAARLMEVSLRQAAEGREAVIAIRAMSSAYLRFAHNNRHLYEAMMSLHAPGPDATFHERLWTFTVGQVERIAGAERAPQATVALWAFLHGAVMLEAAQVFGELKPASGLDFGFEAWLSAACGHEGASKGNPNQDKREARRKAPARKRSARRSRLAIPYSD
jgi:AcrR family transcriptional regulator